MTARDNAKQVPAAETPPAPLRGLDPVAAFLENTVSCGASSQEVAEIVGEAFQGIGRALVPIIGQRGVAALYRRSLHVAGPSCARISEPTEAAPIAMDIALLESELAQQTAAEAAAAGTELLQGFHVLLTTLIGPLLTERLLRPVWIKFWSGPPARNTTS